MNGALRDPRVILGALAILKPIFLAVVFQWWRHRKAISYEIVSYGPLFFVQQDLGQRVQILLDDKPVVNVHVAIVKIANTGGVPIEEQDFVTPISINFGKEPRAALGETEETSPGDLPPCSTLNPRRAGLAPQRRNGDVQARFQG